MTESRTDVGHRYADPETLASYAGSWVLVRKRRVVASAPTARALVDEARRRSLLGYAFYVPVEPVHVDA